MMRRSVVPRHQTTRPHLDRELQCRDPDMGGSVDLSEVPVDALVKEVQRRMECANKPEKRIILIGALPLPLGHAASSGTHPCLLHTCTCVTQARPGAERAHSRRRSRCVALHAPCARLLVPPQPAQRLCKRG